jgi:hypothetical protein
MHPGPKESKPPQKNVRLHLISFSAAMLVSNSMKDKILLLKYHQHGTYGKMCNLKAGISGCKGPFHLKSTPSLLTRLLILDPFGNYFSGDPEIYDFSQAPWKYLLMWFHYDRPPRKFSSTGSIFHFPPSEIKKKVDPFRNCPLITPSEIST